MSREIQMENDLVNEGLKMTADDSEPDYGAIGRLLCGKGDNPENKAELGKLKDQFEAVHAMKTGAAV